jgi:energy-coupling factor transporter ATP-binding protein EcfA2
MKTKPEKKEIFRKDEVIQILNWIRDGESASIIGVSNVGKSTLFQSFQDLIPPEMFTSESGLQYLFVRVNFHNLSEFSVRGVYSLILEQLEMIDQDGSSERLPDHVMKEIGRCLDGILENGEEVFKIQRFFKQAIRACMQVTNIRMIILFDQFDQVYRQADDQLFYNLRGLHDTYNDRISYLVFVRDALPDLPIDRPGPNPAALDSIEAENQAQLSLHNAELAREEFYELVIANHLFLQPYRVEDTTSMLRKIVKRRGWKLDDVLIEPFYHLSGGHAGLVKMCLLFYIENGAECIMNRDVEALLENLNITRECEAIWDSLDEDEQTALVGMVRLQTTHKVQQKTESRRYAEMKLVLKGLRNSDNNIFSPIFKRFVQRHLLLIDRPVWLDEKKRIVYIQGSPRPKLTLTEFRLFKALYDHPLDTVTYEAIFQACWQSEVYDKVHSPSNINQHISRIRKKLMIEEEDSLIENRSSEGYTLNMELDDA